MAMSGRPGENLKNNRKKAKKIIIINPPDYSNEPWFLFLKF